MQEELNQEKEDVYISELDHYKDIIEEKLEIKGIYLFLKETKNLKYSYSNFEKYMKKQNYKIKNVTSDMMSPKQTVNKNKSIHNLLGRNFIMKINKCMEEAIGS